MFIKHKNLYYVGGVVRDEILGTASFDTDFCYEGNAIDFAKNAGLNIIKENPDFGTVRVLFEGKEVDIASTREEYYPQKGHLPVVKNIGCPLEDDLKRRDFTINAMAKNTLTNEIVDLYNGMEDIKNKKLRVLHNESFIDDPTRIIRGLKFSVRFGFEPEKETQALQEEYLNNINYDMSSHRLRKEIIETFNLNRTEAYDKFIEQKIYKLLGQNIVPTKIPGQTIRNAIVSQNPKSLWLFYIACFEPLNTNIQFTRNEKKIFEWVNRLNAKEKVTNNTPEESIIIHKFIGVGRC